jgi:predicted nucleotidyltransferase
MRKLSEDSWNILHINMAEINLEQKRKDYRINLEKSLERIIIQVREIPEISKVISFGSYASGRRDLFTDLDLIVIMETDKDFIRRTADLYRILKRNVDLDLLVYTPEEFNKMKEGSFLRKALQYGQVIYEKKRA